VLESQKTHIAETWEMERVLRHVAGKDSTLLKNKYCSTSLHLLPTTYYCYNYNYKPEEFLLLYIIMHMCNEKNYFYVA
jgi:hypothetical protein